MQCAGCAGWEEDGGHGGVGAKREADGCDVMCRRSGCRIREGEIGTTQRGQMAQRWRR
jgi:hypothetical protein